MDGRGAERTSAVRRGEHSRSASPRGAGLPGPWCPMTLAHWTPA